ncbi:hypothetical protein KIH74_17725 [Kineosporia sp. J2-2]|uniref:Phosphoribosyltransferase domain-containing protein n=1 Tax=Kineosporia corallincola TaxID=2835133 RepID=A0ABS5TI78_9ACTN|nr:phosphoribosyltransferase family protein [Kineosporia corallincola]MBT0770787.1 hypothetical protein [Kineosporia corallincola]
MFADRHDAGRRLGQHLVDRLGFLVPAVRRPLVLALPRGGVPVGVPVAVALNGDLDIVIARKIAAPGQPEYGIGALAEDGPPVFDGRALEALGLSEADLSGAVEHERAEVGRRMLRYRAGRAAPEAHGRIVVVVDDGLATGVTARATLRWLHGHEPAYLVLAAPVCSRQAHDALAGDADVLACLRIPDEFRAVGDWYQDFRQLTDDDVTGLLTAT